MKKITCLFLVAVSVFCLFACKEKDNRDPYDTSFDPYHNIFKDDVPVGDKISVKGKSFYFSEIDIRDKNSEKQTIKEKALRQLYNDNQITVYFHDEKTVEFKESVSEQSFFSQPKTECDRDGNVLTFKKTNSVGFTYDVRIEVHENKIIVIHNGHTYDTEGMYAMITFVQ